MRQLPLDNKHVVSCC